MKTRREGKSPDETTEDPLEEKLKDLLEKKMELRGLASQVKIVPTIPVNSTTPIPQYAAPLAYGVHEPDLFRKQRRKATCQGRRPSLRGLGSLAS